MAFGEDLLVTVLTWPLQQARPEMILWLVAQGVPASLRHWSFIYAHPQQQALELAVERARGRGLPRALFLENDLIPLPETADLFDVEADVAACRCGGRGARARHGPFHLAMWLTSLRALRCLGDPPRIERLPGQCLCRSLEQAFAEAGLSIRAGGAVQHAAPPLPPVEEQSR
jgi:hypothetical protein